MKEMIKRAKRTFLQAAAGYIATNLVYIISSNVDNYDYLKNALLGMCISAASAGIAALMNWPKKNGEG